MTGPLNFDFSKLRGPSSLPTKDEEEPVAGPLNLDLVKNLSTGRKTVEETGQAFINEVHSDAIARVGQPEVAPYDPSVFARGTVPGAPVEAPKDDVQAFLRPETQPTDVLGVATSPTSTAPLGAPHEGRATRLRREAEEYLHSPQKIADDLKNTAEIRATPTGLEGLQQKLGSMRIFTNRSLIEFNNNNSSGFHVGTPFAHPAETAKELIVGLPKFFVDLVRQPVALVLDKLEPGGYLLPEEKAQYQREVIANYAGLIAGGAFGSVSKELRIGRDILRGGVGAAERAGIAAPIGELEQVAATLPKALRVESSIPGKVVTGIHEGIVGGATTGALAGETPEESRNMMATYALMALPAGVAFEGLMGRIRSKKIGPVSQSIVDASNLSLIRQYQAASSISLENGVNTFLALRNADDLAMAAEHVSHGGPIVVQGVTKFKPSETSVIHERPDGLKDIAWGVPDIEIVEPAKVVAATIELPDGRVFEDPRNHGEAWNKAIDSGTLPDELKTIDIPEGVKSGFRLDDGRIVTADEAIELRRKQEATPHAEITNKQMQDVFRVGGYFPHEIVGFLGNDYHYVDPVIDAKGKLTHHKIMDANGHVVEVPWDQLRHGPDMAINSFHFDKPAAQKELFRAFTDWVDKQTGGGIPEGKFSDLVAGYVANRGLNPRVTTALHRFLSDRYGEMLRDEALSPQEKAQYRKLVAESSRHREKTANELVDAATSNGMYIERQNGALIIRDAEHGSYLELARSPEEALQFVQNTVEMHGADFTPNGIPDGVNRGLIPVPPPPNGPHTSAFNPHSNGWFGDLRDVFNVSSLGTKFTGMRQVMISLDNQLGTQFFAQVYNPLQIAHLRKYANMHGDMVRLADTSRLARGLDPEQLEQITTARETMSPEDMVKPGGLFTRGFNPREIAGAQWFIENQIDIPKTWQYFRGLKKLENNPRFYRLPEADKIEAVHKLQASLAMDEAHIEAARIIGEVISRNKPGELSVYGILRLAEAVMDGHVNQADYIANHFPAADTEAGVKMRKVLEEVGSHFNDLADTFDIPDEQRLGGYFAHLRNFKNDEIIAGRDGAPVFTSELLRTGEMSEFDRDPINVLARYINSGYSNRFTKAALDNAYEYLNNTTAQMTDPAHGDYVKRLLTENYVNELRGIPHASTSFVEKIINGVLDRMGAKSDVSVRRDIVNTFLSLTSSATIGFRPVQGIRDFHNFSSIYYTRFGAERLGNLYTMMARVTPQELEQAGIIAKSQFGESASAAMAREGTIPTLGPVSVMTAQERLQNTIAARTQPFREAIQKTADAGIKWGLQHNVYQWAHAASYLESSTRAMAELNKLANLEYGTGDAAKARAYDNIFLNSYDPPVAAYFDQLVTEGKFRDAADFLGRATSFETVSTFGLANHPAGWGTNTGRLFGQFGNWPVWARTTLARMLSRGTRQERTRVAVRFGITQGSLALASAALGLNLNSWYLPTAAPLVSAGQHLGAAAESYDEEQTAEFQKAATEIVLGVPGSSLFRGGPAFGLVASAIGAGQAYPAAERDAARALTQFPLLGVPGSFLLQDIYEGAAMAENGDSPVSAWLRAFGVRSTENESLLNPGGIVTE